MEKNFKDIEKNIKIISDTTQNYDEKFKSYKKVNKLISSAEKKVTEFETILESDDLKEFKNSHSLNIIENCLNGENSDIDLNILFEYLASIKKIKKTFT